MSTQQVSDPEAVRVSLPELALASGDAERAAGEEGLLAPPAPVVHALDLCLNCGHEVDLHFCPQCGQEHREASQMALRPLLSELAQEWVSWDSKMLRTLGALLFQPGRLSAEYNAGRRARYLSPLRLYLVVSALFFLMLGQKTPQNVDVNTGSGASGKITGTFHMGSQTVDLATLPLTVAQFDRQQKTHPLPFPARPIMRQVVKARQSNKSFAQSLLAQFLDDAPKAMFLLLPLFAVLLTLTYRRQKRYYVEHLIFALHSHAFTFLLLTGLILWPNKWGGGGDGAVPGIGILVAAVYHRSRKAPQFIAGDIRLNGRSPFSLAFRIFRCIDIR